MSGESGELSPRNHRKIGIDKHHDVCYNKDMRTTETVAEMEKAVAAGGCPACSCTKVKPYKIDGRPMVGIKECAACSAVYGRCYLGTSYEIVKPAWATAEPPAGTTRYFDFECLGTEVTRRHGWFDP